MATPFLSPEEYDERASRLYDENEYEDALHLLEEGVRLYPHSADLHVGLGLTRLAREEFAWARRAFAAALVLDPDGVDARVGLGEVLLWLGRDSEALECFRRVRASGVGDDLDLLLTMGRALYRTQRYEEARDVFSDAVSRHPDNAEAMAAVAYTVYRLGDARGAQRKLRRAIELDAGFHEARVCLGHLLYDRGDWRGALEQFERVPRREHRDALAIWRLMELKRLLHGLEADDPEVAAWEDHLVTVEGDPDPVEELLAEVRARGPADDRDLT